MPAEVQSVYLWLKALGVLTAGGASEEVADNKLHAYAPLLAEEFDQACFCRSSLAFVARGSKFFPAFSEVCELLAQWWRKQRPYPDLALSGPADPWNASVQRDWSDPVGIEASVRALDDNPMRIALGRVLAAAVEYHAPQLIGLIPWEFRQAVPDGESRVIRFPSPGAAA